MSRSSLAIVAVLVIATATFMRSPVARAQTGSRLEYVRVTPYVVRTAVAPNAVQERIGYRACVAGVNEWTCREFQPTQSSTDALRTALATLGNEGWELVSAVEEDPIFNHSLTYLFKRPAR